ncbi:MAG: nuclear transport factor 2 family protein [Methanobrevibacter sp.]|nr:nuclear transport factor 2 family protein [Methanobrevibacter sp.]
MNDITINDYEEIIKAGELYLAGCNGTSDIMKKAFHENATINGAPIQTLYDGVDEAGPGNCNGRIDVLDVANDVAVIRITMEDYFGANYIDFHILKKEEDGWKILAKAFTEW